MQKKKKKRKRKGRIACEGKCLKVDLLINSNTNFQLSFLTSGLHIATQLCWLPYIKFFDWLREVFFVIASEFFWKMSSSCIQFPSR